MIFQPLEKSKEYIINSLPVNNKYFSDITVIILNQYSETENFMSYDISKLKDNIYYIYQKSPDVNNEIIINTNCIVDYSLKYQSDIGWSKCKDTKIVRIELKGE